MRMDFYSDEVEKAIPNSSATVTGDGSKFEARVISDEFDGLTTIKRHKMVYAVLDQYIKTGAIHALSIKAYTKSEWSEEDATWASISTQVTTSPKQPNAIALVNKWPTIYRSEQRINDTEPMVDLLPAHREQTAAVGNRIRPVIEARVGRHLCNIINGNQS